MMANHDPLKPGDRLDGRYEIVRLLGSGGYGAIYEARQGALGRPVALKVMLARLAERPTAVERFLSEGRFVCSLNHPNTVICHEFGCDERLGLLFMAMEYLDGESLGERLSALGCLELRQTTRIILQVCASLGEAHSRGLIHRDIKPGNLMLIQRAGRDDFVKVIDFGIAKAMDHFDGEHRSLTATGAIIGTASYMAPEQIRHDRPLDARADIYALGCLAYRALAGVAPFRGASAMDVATRHLTTPAPRISSLTRRPIPPRLERLLLTTLSKDPDDRPPTVEALALAWCEAVDDFDTPAELGLFPELTRAGRPAPTVVMPAARVPAHEPMVVPAPTTAAPRTTAPPHTPGAATAPETPAREPATTEPMSPPAGVAAWTPRQRRQIALLSLLALGVMTMVAAAALGLWRVAHQQRSQPEGAMVTRLDGPAPPSDTPEATLLAGDEDGDEDNHEDNHEDDHGDEGGNRDEDDGATPRAPAPDPSPLADEASKSPQGDDPAPAQPDDARPTAGRAAARPQPDAQPRRDAPRRALETPDAARTTEPPTAPTATDKPTARPSGDSEPPRDAASTGRDAAPSSDARKPEGGALEVRLKVHPWGEARIGTTTIKNRGLVRLKPGVHRVTVTQRGQHPVVRTIRVSPERTSYQVDAATP